MAPTEALASPDLLLAVAIGAKFGIDEHVPAVADKQVVPVGQQAVAPQGTVFADIEPVPQGTKHVPAVADKQVVPVGQQPVAPHETVFDDIEPVPQGTGQEPLHPLEGLHWKF